MGLQIAEKYAKLLGSRIQFESEFNKGSTFYFDLSLKRENIEKIVIRNPPKVANKESQLYLH